MTDLTTGQRNRLIALARAGKSLPWGRSDNALEVKKLVRKYRGPFDETFSDLTNEGMKIAHQIARSR